MSYLPCDYYFVYIKQELNFYLKGSFEVFKKNNQILYMKIDWWGKTSFTFTKIYFPFTLVYRIFFVHLSRIYVMSLLISCAVYSNIQFSKMPTMDIFILY